MILVGQVLHGYCGGIFGRDSYGNKRVEAVGFDWIVVREADGTPNFAVVKQEEHDALVADSERWKKEHEGDEP